MIRYVVPYQVMQHWLGSRTRSGTNELDLSYNHFIALVRRYIEPVRVDPAWYAATYQGVARAVARGTFSSVEMHYLAHGYFENRLPFAPDNPARQPILFHDIIAQVAVHPARGELRVGLTTPAMLAIVEQLLHSVPVDEAWYCRTYPGVAAAIARQDFPSAAVHYARYGYAESRWPFPMTVEADWYLSRYPDAARTIADGGADSAQDHFWRCGYREGRFPSASPLS